jgi:hypothetical protein
MVLDLSRFKVSRSLVKTVRRVRREARWRIFLDRNFEAVITRTVWPNWVADLEANKYDNPAFVPIEFVDFTAGYDTNSAVLFPETVATRELAKFHWGGIFCDREAARFRSITGAASELLKLAMPAELELMLADQRLTQETFVLWDLVHDRAHRADHPDGAIRLEDIAAHVDTARSAPDRVPACGADGPCRCAGSGCCRNAPGPRLRAAARGASSRCRGGRAAPPAAGIRSG